MGTLFETRKKIHISRPNSAFTIVELLIVVVVIAILAAITIVAYNGVTKRAEASAVQSNLNQAVTKLEMYKIDNSSYPAVLSDAGIAEAGGVTYYYAYDNTVSPATYCVTATKNTTSYLVSNSNTSPVAGSCPITNMANDPAATAFDNNDTLGNGRWSNNRYTPYNSYSLLTGQSGIPSGLTTAARLTVTTAGSVGIGFHLAGNPDANMPPVAQAIPVKPGQSLTISAYMRWTGTSGEVIGFAARFIDSSGAWIGGTFGVGSGVAAPSGVWIHPYGTVTAPTNAAGLALLVRRTGGPSFAAGDMLDGTGLMITSSSTSYNYADGNSSGWSWNGTPNASTSTGPAL